MDVKNNKNQPNLCHYRQKIKATEKVSETKKKKKDQKDRVREHFAKQIRQEIVQSSRATPRRRHHRHHPSTTTKVPTIKIDGFKRMFFFFNTSSPPFFSPILMSFILSVLFL